MRKDDDPGTSSGAPARAPGSGFAARVHGVLLSHGLWQRLYGGDETIVGRALRLEANAGKRAPHGAGATASDILRLVMRDALRILVLGLGLGLVPTLFVGPFLESLLYGVPGIDPWTVLGVSLVLSASVLAASAVPARRAARMDPMAALRYE